MQLNQRFNVILYSIFGLVFLLLVTQPIVGLKDSQGYLDMIIGRSPVYPVFLKTISLVFGSFFKQATLIIQLLFGFWGIFYFIKSLKKHLNIHSAWWIALTLVLLIPYLYQHKVGNTLLSEALAYPLYLIVTAKFVVGFITQNRKHIAYALPILLVLLLTRTQFLFMVPIGILVLVWIYFAHKKEFKTLLIALLLVLVPLASNVLDKTYHYVAHDYFGSTPWTGIHLLAPAMFVANETDVSIFENENERHFFSEIFTSLKGKQLNINHLPEDTFDPEYTYISNFTAIANRTIWEDGKFIVGEKGKTNTAYIKVDTITKNMALPLAMKNKGAWIKLYVKNFIYGFSSAHFFLLYIILICFGAFWLFKKNTPETKVLIFGSALVVCNVAIVAIGMHTIKRFTFYNDWVLYLILFLLLNSITKYIKNYGH